jgi:hypothetical protein
MVERMLGGKRERRQLLPPRAVRLIVDRPAPLVLHHVALRVELLLRHRREQPAHAIGFQPERDGQLVRRDGLEVVGSVQPGRPVERPAGTLHQLEVLVRGDVLGSLEQHVLEQVREAGSPDSLVRRSDVVPQVHRNDGSRVVLGQRDEQSVRQSKGVDR